MKYLCIGGVADGKWYHVDKDRNVLYVRVPEKPSVTPFNDHVSNVGPRDERYEKEYFKGQKEEFELFRCSYLTVDEMIKKLISGYRPE